MSSLKAEVKIGMARELGQSYASMMSGFKEEVTKLEGERRAYDKVEVALESVYKRVDDDFRGGKYENLAPVDVAKLLKQTLLQISKGLDNLKTQADASRYHNAGRLDGLVKASEFVEKIVLAEQAKLEVISDSLPVDLRPATDSLSGDTPMVAEGFTVRPLARVPGTRPSPGIAAQRKASVVEEPAQGTPLGLAEMVKQSGVRSVSASLVGRSGGGRKGSQKTRA